MKDPTVSELKAKVRGAVFCPAARSRKDAKPDSAKSAGSRNWKDPSSRSAGPEAELPAVSVVERMPEFWATVP